MTDIIDRCCAFSMMKYRRKKLFSFNNLLALAKEVFNNVID